MEKPISSTRRGLRSARRRREERLFGPDVCTASAGMGLTTVLFGIFFAIAVVTMPAAVVAVGALLYVLTAALWLATATVHPGIVPPHTLLPDAESAQYSQLARTMDVGARELPLRWCYHCRAFRPPRAVHCPDCNVCVTRWDHHCPWVGQCVGQRNYKYFLGYIWLLTLLSLYVGTFLGIYAFRLVAEWDVDGFTRVLGGGAAAVLYNGIGVIAVAVGVVIGVVCVGPLAFFHASLTLADATTSQQDRTAYTRSGACGGGAANCHAVLCGAQALHDAWCAECEAVFEEERARRAVAGAESGGGSASGQHTSAIELQPQRSAGSSQHRQIFGASVSVG